MSFLRRFILQILIGVLGFFIADYLIEEVNYNSIEGLIGAGVIFGFVNYFVKPIIKIISLPVRIITLGLFTFFINIAIVWFVQMLWEEVSVEGFLPLLYTTIILWASNIIIYLFFKK